MEFKGVIISWETVAVNSSKYFFLFFVLSLLIIAVMFLTTSRIELLSRKGIYIFWISRTVLSLRQPLISVKFALSSSKYVFPKYSLLARISNRQQLYLVPSSLFLRQPYLKKTFYFRLSTTKDLSVMSGMHNREAKDVLI